MKLSLVAVAAACLQAAPPTVAYKLREDDHWYNVVFRGKDKNEGNVRVLNVRSKTMIWAGEAGDRSLFYGSLHRGGERKVADRIVHRMKKDLFH